MQTGFKYDERYNYSCCLQNENVKKRAARVALIYATYFYESNVKSGSVSLAQMIFVLLIKLHP